MRRILHLVVATAFTTTLLGGVAVADSSSDAPQAPWGERSDAKAPDGTGEGGGTPLPAEGEGEGGIGAIVGGAAVGIASRPFQVAFFPGSSICGASLIHPSYLLTAAHCVDGLSGSSSVAARFASGTWASGGFVRSGTASGGGDITGVAYHLSWNDVTSDNDIALVALDNPVPLSANVQTVRVIEPGMESQWAAGVPSVVSGWGTTSSGGSLASQLRSVTVPIVSGSYCGSGSSYGSGFHGATMLCAGAIEGGKDSCQGDSGGPLTVAGSGGGPFQVGIVSWGFGCALPTYPGIYTRLSNYNTWLRQLVPLSDTFDDAYLLNGTTSEDGTMFDATRQSGEPFTFGLTEHSIWYRCVATSNGTYAVNTNGSSADTVLGVYTGTAVNDLTLVAMNDDGGSDGTDSALTFTAEKGTTYKIQVATFNLVDGDTVLNRTLPCHRETFPDVGRYSTFFEDIEWLSGNDITTGYADGTFKPSAGATRQALVAYLYRMEGSPLGPFPSPPFSDVDGSHPFYTEIAWASSSGVVGGFGDGTFRPTATVSRQALVSFLYGLAGSPLGPFPNPGFSDVAPSHPFYTQIAWAASSDVIGGYANGTFRPGAAISRQAIAALLHRYALLGT